ncbi:hypothetical protein E2320_007089, partial [Naja naja]
LPQKCKLPPKKGKCKKILERVYYDPEKETCLNFIYGGCDGNRNNFATIQDCFYKCKKFGKELPRLANRCRLNPKKGWCQKHSTRYYYDSKLHQCREFNYHGCGGNENNFSNYIDCVKACDVFVSLKHFRYTISQHLYLHFSYDEINVSETTFSPSPSLSFLPVFLPQKCKLPPKKGRCNEDFENFYYDHNSNMCKTFIFGGCGGNKNNFVNLLDCYYTCKRFETPWNCKLWARKGKCKGKIPRYYYDAFNKRCRLFTYGGCGEAMLDTCDQPLDVGPCKENFTRFYYDRTTKICKPFKFGGCNGNRNNFLNREDCLQECK